MSTICKLKAHQAVDTGAVLRKLGAVRQEAKAVRDSVQPVAGSLQYRAEAPPAKRVHAGGGLQ